MKTKLIIILYMLHFGVAAQSTAASSPEWLIHSFVIQFKIKNAGFTVDGSFDKLTGRIIFDQNKSYGNLMEATIDVKSIHTGNATRDGHLLKEEYFDAAHYPTMSMKAILFTKQDDGSFKGFFKLTIKNQTKDIVVPFTFNEKDNKANLKGTFAINRLDYGVGESSMILSDKVMINIELTVIKK